MYIYNKILKPLFNKVLLFFDYERQKKIAEEEMDLKIFLRQIEEHQEAKKRLNEAIREQKKAEIVSAARLRRRRKEFNFSDNLTRDSSNNTGNTIAAIAIADTIDDNVTPSMESSKSSSYGYGGDSSYSSSSSCDSSSCSSGGGDC